MLHCTIICGSLNDGIMAHLDPLVPWWAMQVRSNAITTSYFNIWVWVNTYRYILVGWTSIYQLFWGSLGTRVLTHPHISLTFSLTFIASGLALSRISTNSQFLLPLINSALLKQHETVKKALLGCADSRGDGKGIEKCWLLVSNVFISCPGGSVWIFSQCHVLLSLHSAGGCSQPHEHCVHWLIRLLTYGSTRLYESTVCEVWKFDSAEDIHRFIQTLASM